MAAKELDVFQGTMTYNTVSLYSNGTKKRFSGFIVIKDTNGNETSYKINSFRSQVSIQSEALGERGMAGMKATAHGYFKENTWNGETKWELMCEKLYLEGYEQLAADAEAASTPMPAVPPGQLPGTMHQPIAPVAQVPGPPPGPVPVATPVMPAPLPTHGTMAPTSAVSGPAPIVGGYIHVETSAVPTPPLNPVAPAPIMAAPPVPPTPVAPIQPVAPVPPMVPTPPKVEEEPFEIENMPSLTS